MAVAVSALINTVIVLGLSQPPIGKILVEILEFSRVEGAILVPSMINGLCQDGSG